MDISVVIPTYNEEANVDKLYQRLSEVMQQLSVSYELVFVNDGSRDRTIALIKDLAGRDERVKYIDFSRNFGHQIAVTAGLDRCGGQAIVIFDADLQDPPELIIEMYQKMKEGYEVVYAKRKTAGEQAGSRSGRLAPFTASYPTSPPSRSPLLPEIFASSTAR